MKRTFSLLIIAMITGSFVASQESTVPIGFVNAVGLTSKTAFMIDGQSLKPAGFSEGAFAGSFGLSEGSHQFSFSNADCEKVATRIEIKKGASPLYILYNVGMPQTDGKIKNVLKLTGVPPQAADNKARFFAFSTLEGRSADLRINEQPMSFQPLKLAPIAGTSVAINSNDGRPLHISPREAGNYVFVLFMGANFRLRWALVEMAH